MVIGFIGLGQLGSRLSQNLLQAGHSLVVFDRDSAKMEAMCASGATGADSTAALAQASEVVITCLPSPAASRDVMAGKNGVLPAMKVGSTWMEMSTTSVAEARKMHELAAGHGINMLEAPLTGGVHRAASGEMTILVGGDEDLYASHCELLDTLGGQVIYMGEVGNASLLKVITNLLCLVDLVAAGEALMLAKKGGLDLGTCYRAICASSGSSREFEDWAPVILNGTMNTGFTTDLGLKDLGLVADLGEQHGVPLKLTGLVKSLFEESRERFGGDAWTPYVVKMLEEEVGEEIRSDGFSAVIETVWPPKE